MRKIIIFISTIVIIALNSSMALAVMPTDILTKPTSPTQPTLLLGQNHNYSVHFRSNGEAIVTARIVFNNTGDLVKDSFSVDMPEKTYEVYALQQIYSGRCDRYEYSTTPGTSYNSSKCVQYTEPDYTQEYYGYSDNSVNYKKSSITQNANKYTFSLPESVKADKSGSIIIAYATKAYTKASWGNTSFDFVNFKVDQRIQKMRVSVSFDDDIYFEGKKSTTTYAPESTAGLSALADSTGASANSSLKSYVGNVGNGGVLTKEASSLAPGDYYHVKGSFATSWWALNRAKVVWTVVGIVVFVVAMFLLTKWRGRRGKPIDPTQSSGDARGKPTTKSEVSQSELAGITSSSTRTMRVSNRFFKLQVTPLFGSFLYGLFSMLSSTLALGVVSIILSAIMQNNNFNIGTVGILQMILGIAATVITALLGVFTLPVLLGRRLGLRYFFYVLSFEVIWLLIVIFVLSFFAHSSYQPDYTGGGLPI